MAGRIELPAAAPPGFVALAGLSPTTMPCFFGSDSAEFHKISKETVH
jgi:hypothetical protein